MKNDKNFLESLKAEFDRSIQIKERLDNKANGIMTIAGTVATLLFGVSVLFFDKLDPSYTYVNFLMFSFIFGLVFIIATILCSIIVHLLRNYQYPLDENLFFNGEDLNNSKIDEFRGAEEEVFSLTMINNYLKCNKHNSNANGSKTNFIEASHWCFFIGFLSLVPMLGFLIHAFYVGAFHSTSSGMLF